MRAKVKVLSIQPIKAEIDAQEKHDYQAKVTDDLKTSWNFEKDQVSLSFAYYCNYDS